MKSKDIAIVIEEAHQHASRQKMVRYDLGEPLILRTLRMGRKHGVYVIVVDQTPSQLPDAVLGNLATRMVMRLTNSPCVYMIAKTMGLDANQAKALVELARRRAIVQTAVNPKPFMISVVEIPKRYRPAESELRERERVSLGMLDFLMPQVQVVDVLFGKRDKEVLDVALIRGDMHKVLARICQIPDEVIEERCEAIGIERAREGRARVKLERLGTIELANKVGSKLLLYAPTEKGIKWAKSLGIEVPRFKSGVAHQYMARRVEDSMGRFFGEDIRFFEPGKSLGISGVQPDLLAGLRREEVDTGWRMAVQISCTNKARYEVDRAVEIARIPQVDRVIIVAKNKGHMRDIERQLRKVLEKEGVLKGEKESGKRKNRETHIQKTGQRIETLDFETCVSEGYDWGWVME